MSISINSIDKICKLTALVLLVMTGVLLPGKNYGQDDQLKSLEKKIRDNSPAFASEKLFVHTDKSFYQPDEIIWMKLYVTDAVTHRPLDISKLAYAELINENGKAVLQARSVWNRGRAMDHSLCLLIFLPAIIF
ncbi:MAG: hypothetical protein WDO19_32680 [Bacteroidota bacterium]